jgi:hypothetical protein
MLRTARNFIILPMGTSQPPIQWVPGALSLGVKQPVREADHTPAASAEVKNAWSYTSTTQYAFKALCLVKKHRVNFTLLRLKIFFHLCTRLRNSLFRWGCQTKILYAFLISHTCCMFNPFQFHRLDNHLANIRWQVEVTSWNVRWTGTPLSVLWLGMSSMTKVRFRSDEGTLPFATTFRSVIRPTQLSNQKVTCSTCLEVLGKLQELYLHSVCIVLGYELDDRGSRVRFPAEVGNFSLHHCVQNGSGAHPASYPMDTRGSFRGSKAARSWSWPLTSI